MAPKKKRPLKSASAARRTASGIQERVQRKGLAPSSGNTAKPKSVVHAARCRAHLFWQLFHDHEIAFGDLPNVLAAYFRQEVIDDSMATSGLFHSDAAGSSSTHDEPVPPELSLPGDWLPPELPLTPELSLPGVWLPPEPP